MPGGHAWLPSTQHKARTRHTAASAGGRDATAGRVNIMHCCRYKTSILSRSYLALRFRYGVFCVLALLRSCPFGKRIQTEISCVSVVAAAIVDAIVAVRVTSIATATITLAGATAN